MITNICKFIKEARFSLAGFYACKIFAPVVTEYAIIILSFGIKSICFKSNCIIVSIIHAWQQHAACADIVVLHYDNLTMQYTAFLRL